MKSGKNNTVNNLLSKNKSKNDNVSESTKTKIMRGLKELSDKTLFNILEPCERGNNLHRNKCERQNFHKHNISKKLNKYRKQFKKCHIISLSSESSDISFSDLLTDDTISSMKSDSTSYSNHHEKNNIVHPHVSIKSKIMDRHIVSDTEPLIDKPLVDKPLVDKPLIDKPLVDKPLDNELLEKNKNNAYKNMFYTFVLIFLSNLIGALVVYTKFILF